MNVNPVIWKCWYFSSSFTVSASKESDVDGKPETHVGHMWFERKANSKNWIQVQVSPFAKRNETRCWFFGRNTAHDIDQLICHWSIQHNVKTKVEFEASKTKVVRLFVVELWKFSSRRIWKHPIHCICDERKPKTLRSGSYANVFSCQSLHTLVEVQAPK